MSAPLNEAEAPTLPRPGQIGTDADGLPILAAYRTADGQQLAVWCEHEHRWHRHGAVSGARGAGDGHRGAHCICQQTFWSPGYVVREVGPLTDELLAAYRALPYQSSCSWDSCRLERDAARKARRVGKSKRAPAGLASLVDRVLAPYHGKRPPTREDRLQLEFAARTARRDVAAGRYAADVALDALTAAAALAGYVPETVAALMRSYLAGDSVDITTRLQLMRSYVGADPS